MLTLPIFVVALGAMFAKMHFVQKGNLRKLRVALWVSLVSSTLLGAAYAFAVFSGGGAFDLIIAGFWLWIAYGDLKQIFNF